MLRELTCAWVAIRGQLRQPSRTTLKQSWKNELIRQAGLRILKYQKYFHFPQFLHAEIKSWISQVLGLYYIVVFSKITNVIEMDPMIYCETFITGSSMAKYHKVNQYFNKFIQILRTSNGFQNVPMTVAFNFNIMLFVQKMFFSVNSI